jgi:hypothetical protein
MAVYAQLGLASVVSHSRAKTETVRSRLRNGYPNGYPVTRATHGILVILEVKILKFLKFANSFKRRFNFYRTLGI